MEKSAIEIKHYIIIMYYGTQWRERRTLDIGPRDFYMYVQAAFFRKMARKKVGEKRRRQHSFCTF